jgi:iron(III) transport system ATP-binding protein
MNAGRVEQVDSSEIIFEKPRTRFVADFMGAGNFMTDSAGRTFVVRPEKMKLSEVGSTKSIEAMVLSRSYQGASTIWTVRTTRGETLAISDANGQLRPGEKAYLSWESRDEVFLT